MLIRKKRLIVADPDAKLSFRIYIPARCKRLIYCSDYSFVLDNDFISFKRWAIYIPPVMVSLRYKLVMPVALKYRSSGLY